MAKFVFIACPLNRVEINPRGFTSREIEIMSANKITRTFEAGSVVEAQTRFNEIVAEIRAGVKWDAIQKGADDESIS